MQKNQAMPLFCSRDIFDLKILQFDWPGAFRSLPQEPDFSQIWDLCRNIVNNTNFHYRLIQENLFKNVFNIFKKKTVFDPFSLFSGQKKLPSQKSGSAIHDFIWFSNTMPKFRNN